MSGAGHASQSSFGFSRAALHRLDAIAQPVSHAVGELLFREGDAPSGLFLIEDGHVAVAARSPGDEQLRVVDVGPGGMVGELALFDDAKRSATARVTSPMQGRFLSKARFAGLVFETEAGAVDLIGEIRAVATRRLRMTYEAIAAQPESGVAMLRRGTLATPSACPDLPADPAAMLRGLIRFSGFGPALTVNLLKHAEIIAFGKGDNLADAGDASGILHIILRGAVMLGVERPGGIEQVAVHGPGEFAGLVATLDGGSHPLSAQAGEDGLALRIDRAGFNRMCAQSSELSCHVLDLIARQLVRDLRRANRHLGRAEALANFNARAG